MENNIALFEPELLPPAGEVMSEAHSAFERLLNARKSTLQDWLIVGMALQEGVNQCQESGKSYPKWCIDNGFDYTRLGTKGKGAIYDAPWLYENRENVIDEVYGNATMSNPSHIRYAYNKSLKEISALDRQEQREQMALEALNIPVSDRWRVFNDNMETWQADKKYDWIITDPPYPREFLPLWKTLADRSKEWLKPGGLIVAMSGHSYLDIIIKSFIDAGCSYYWMAAYMTPGLPTPTHKGSGRNINTTWKPLLMFAPNEWYDGKGHGDVFKSDGNDKDHHKWGQSESGMLDIVSKLCLSGESILDPFMGAGTTGVAAIKHGCLFDGVELDEKNCGISKVRINDAAM